MSRSANPITRGGDLGAVSEDEAGFGVEPMESVLVLMANDRQKTPVRQSVTDWVPARTIRPAPGASSHIVGCRRCHPPWARSARTCGRGFSTLVARARKSTNPDGW